MKNKFFILALSLFLLSGCASFFTVGEENFACKGDPEGGQCGDPKTIYKNREKILSEYEDKGDKNKKPKGEGKNIKVELTVQDNHNNHKFKQDSASIPMPVRQAEEIRRAYINGFEDHKGNLIGNIWTFIVVNNGDWLLPDGRRIVNVE
jgi:type IV conjugative transfer system lipoprotein TraV